MSDHKKLQRSVAEATPQPSPAATPADQALPLAPVPIPVMAPDSAGVSGLLGAPAAPTTIRRTVEGDFDFDQPTRQRRSKEDPVAGAFDFNQPTRQRRSKADGPALPPRPGNELDSLDNYKHSPAKAKKVLGITDGQFMETPIGKFSAESSATKRAEVAKVKAGERDPKVHQPVADLGEIYAHCSMLEAEFKYQVERVAKASKGKAIFRPGGKMKGLDRTLEKMAADYGGDPSRMVDLTGGSISFDSADDLVAGYGAVASNPMFRIVRLKNSLMKGQGYGDINMSLEMGGADIDIVDAAGKVIGKEHYAGFVIELQLHLAEIIATKEAAHKPYEKMRGLDAKNEQAGVGKNRANWSATDRQDYEDASTKMAAMYGQAWDKLGDKQATVAKLKAIVPVDPT